MRKTPSRFGFSLVELMVALGILAITSLLIGTAFLAGGMEHKQSVNDTMGTIIVENARSICAVGLNYRYLMGYWKYLGSAFDPGRFQNITPLLVRLDRTYPTIRSRMAADAEYSVPIEVRSFQLISAEDEPDVFEFLTSTCYGPAIDWQETPPGSGEFLPTSRYGWFALLKHQLPQGWTPDQPLPRMCEIIVIVYRRHLPTDDPDRDLVFWGGYITEDGQVNGSPVNIGAPVILHETGEHAFAVDDEGTLDRPLPEGLAIALEYTRGNKSPVIACQKYQILLGD